MSDDAPHKRKVYLLDTSAILSLFGDEPGAARVEEILRGERVIFPFFVLLEVYYITLREEGEQAADLKYATLKSLVAEQVWFMTEPILLLAGRFKALHALSLADAVIAATASDRGAVLVHKDPEYEPLTEVEQEILPYKRGRN